MEENRTAAGPGGPAAQGEDLAALLGRVAAARDRAAFATLFGHFAPRLKSYFQRLGAAPAQAEDLAQETMLALWHKAALFDPARAGVNTWVFTIARNLRIDALRRDRFQLDPGGVPEELAAPGGAGDERMAVMQSEDRVRAALANLPEEQALVVRLSFFKEKPHQEIGRELGIPLGTVKSRLRLAMARLRAALGEAE
ncbi:MAG: sigma-70 family RNA polymerase sigma factor [Acetobacteraceae bacterium]